MKHTGSLKISAKTRRTKQVQAKRDPNNEVQKVD